MFPKPLYTLSCEQCKIPYKTIRYKQRYCSQACFGLAKRGSTPLRQLEVQAAEKLRLLDKGNEPTLDSSSHNTHYVKRVPQKQSIKSMANEILSCETKDLGYREGVGGKYNKKEGSLDGSQDFARGGSTPNTPQRKKSKLNSIQSTPNPPRSIDLFPPYKTPQKSRKWLEYFMEFIGELQFYSKEHDGLIKLKDHLYKGQWMFIEQVCDGLDHGCREFVVLKARQLGITTVSLALDLFWAFINDGLRSAFVSHEASVTEATRRILDDYVGNLPDDLKLKISKHNRLGVSFSNGSSIDYLVAGTTARTKSLGRGRAYTHVHATEVAFYGNQEAVDSFVAGLAKNHQDRLRIWESTANGFDSPMWEKWSSAKEDKITQRCIFIGWWGNDTYDVSSNAELLLEYGYPVTPDEEDRILKVKELYNVDITDGQLAWYRWYEKSQSRSPHMMMQEYPWTEDEAFIASGHKFFDQKKLSEQIQDATNNYRPFRGYRFDLGEKFVDTRMELCTDVRDVTLRVWEKPVETGEYIISCDPAYGSNDNKDRSVIQVMRCYADRLVQVAEYADEDPLTHQVTWVLAWLAGKYRNCMINLEVSGPGNQIMLELKHLRELAQAGALDALPEATDDQKRERDSFLEGLQSARWYIWNRPDSMGSGYAYGWKTTSENKVYALNAMRDNHTTGNLVLTSLPLMDEMLNIEQNGWDIRASGKHKDDRVMACALGVWGWQQWFRPRLIADNRTYRNVHMDEAERENPQATVMQRIVNSHFQRMEVESIQQQVADAWAEW